MAPPRNNSKEYNTIPDVEANVDKLGVVMIMMMDHTVEKEAWIADVETAPLAGDGDGDDDRDRHGTSVMNNKEPDTYQLSFAFSLMSGTVWFSMFLWGIWIATFYSIAIANRNWHNFNIIFPDLWTDGYPVASIAITIHLIGAVFMSLAGAFQLVKYIRKHYAIVHRWVGRLYVISSVIASCGGLVFIFNKGSYGGREADVAFAVYGFYFLWCGICTYYYAAIAKDYSTHKLWAWRLYALSLAAWIYRADYYFWMLVFGHRGWTWLHDDRTRGLFDYFVNWAFYVPNLIIVEIVYRWGENKHLPSNWSRILNTSYYVLLIMAVVFTVHAASQLWIPSVFGGYDEAHAWILR